MRFRILLFIPILFLFSCEGGTVDPVDPPELSINDSRIFEKAGNSPMTFEIRASKASTEPISIEYRVNGLTAKPDEDFTSSSGTVTLAAGATTTSVTVDVLDDMIKEIDEKLELELVSATNATIFDKSGIGLIQDNDVSDNFIADGYITAAEHYGYQLEWSDEFDGANLDTDIYNFELGDGCDIGLCGWGNQELQRYQDTSENVFLENSHLVIKATREGLNSYNSARIQTKGKKEFRFGRIDIRAKLPKGQGIWPAIWMLGSNIDEVGWPACGEIDIVELVGHRPQSAHGTAHWGAQGDPGSTSSGSAYSVGEDYDQQFHVFTMIWEQGSVTWYIDETKYHQITTDDMRGKPYPFNQPMFFIFNIAVGGQWPGSPDETTVFPQAMEIDYVRVFQ